MATLTDHTYAELAMAVQAVHEDELDGSKDDIELLDMAVSATQISFPELDPNEQLSVAAELFHLYQPIS